VLVVFVSAEGNTLIRKKTPYWHVAQKILV